MGKRGYFFTIDAFIALGIITIGLILVYLAYTSVPVTDQQYTISQDLLTIFSTTELNTINSKYIDEQRISGNITNLQNTIFEQVAFLFASGKVGEAQNMTANLSYTLIPQQYYYEIWLNDTLLNNKSYVTDDVAQLSVSRAMLVGRQNLSSIWGPYKAEVRVWR